MKYVTIGLLVLTLFLSACAQENTPEENIVDMDTEIEVDETQSMDDQEVLDSDVVSIEIQNDTTIITVNESVINDSSELGSYTLTNWCIAGGVWAQSDDEAEFEATIEDITTYKGEDWCKGTTSQTQNSPMGDITIDTVYYISEDQTSYWVIVDAFGQVSENFISIE